jgi:hypothetical protein
VRRGERVLEFFAATREVIQRRGKSLVHLSKVSKIDFLGPDLLCGGPRLVLCFLLHLAILLLTVFYILLW